MSRKIKRKANQEAKRRLEREYRIPKHPNLQQVDRWIGSEKTARETSERRIGNTDNVDRRIG